MRQPMYPPKMHPPMRPQIHHPIRPMQPPMGGYYGMGRKNILPKRPVVQINIGMGRPQPLFVPAPQIGLMPHGPKHLHMPGRGYKNPVGEIIDFVTDPVGYMVEKSLGLRSNKPNAEKKEGEAEKKEEKGEEKTEEKVEIKEEKEENKATNEIVTEEKQEPVLRARKQETEEQQEFEEVEYAEDPELAQEQVQQEQVQQEVICPECAGENLCPECTGENLCPECSAEKLCPECTGEKLCPECSNVKTVKETKTKTIKANTQFSNFNFHEIVATSDNTKSYVVVKKGGVTISES